MAGPKLCVCVWVLGVCVSVCVCARVKACAPHMCRSSQKAEEEIVAPSLDVIGGCELIGAGNQTLVL